MTRDSKKIYGLLGKNIQYSLSPLMHNAAFRHFNIDSEYKLFDTDEADLDGFLRSSIEEKLIGGMNVTVPYKVAVKELLENIRGLSVKKDKWVDFTGALNTLKIEASHINIYNTDVTGFEKSLQLNGVKIDKINDIFLIGAGGVGRIIGLYCAHECARGKIKLFDIDEGKILSLVDMASTMGIDRNIFTVIKKESDIKELIKNCGLVINATPLGTKDKDKPPLDLDLIKKGMLVYDVVYARESDLIKNARAKGLYAIDGSDMLINQGAAAFSIWTGKSFDETRVVMKNVIMKELVKRK